MAKIKLTRNELKAQRESLTRYTRFLPTLELKKLQLEIERRKIEKQIQTVQQESTRLEEQLAQWERMFAEQYPKPVETMVSLEKVITGEANIAGLFVPVFKEVLCKIEEYDLFQTAPWVDSGIDAIKKIIHFREWLRILMEQNDIVMNELRKTTQRINLFKEKLIPECKENIRQIRIYLGDVQAGAVGRAKIAKQKIQRGS